MALFTFRDLQPAPGTSELRQALGVNAAEPLLARRLRGSGRYDRGRRVVEIVVPSRLPAEVNLRAEGLLCDNLDLAAPHFKYGEYFPGDLRADYRADEAVVLHDWAHFDGPEYAIDPDAPLGEPGLILVSETEEEYFHNFALQFFFDPPSWRETLVRPYHALCRATGRPGPVTSSGATIGRA